MAEEGTEVDSITGGEDVEIVPEITSEDTIGDGEECTVEPAETLLETSPPPPPPGKPNGKKSDGIPATKCKSCGHAKKESQEQCSKCATYANIKCKACAVKFFSKGGSTKYCYMCRSACNTKCENCKTKFYSPSDPVGTMCGSCNDPHNKTCKDCKTKFYSQSGTSEMCTGCRKKMESSAKKATSTQHAKGMPSRLASTKNLRVMPIRSNGGNTHRNSLSMGSSKKGFDGEHYRSRSALWPYWMPSQPM